MGAVLLAGCAGPAPLAEDSGLRAVRPWPGPQDVCQVIGETDATRDYLDDSALLIGCPSTEAATIAAHRASGARLLGELGAWTLLHHPRR